MKQCPSCSGSGRFWGFVETTRGGTSGTFACRQCDGAGQVDDERAELLRLGEAMRDHRHAHNQSLRQVALLLGVEPRHLSQVENGRASLEETRTLHLRATKEIP